jgi:hypothetical protein
MRRVLPPTPTTSNAAPPPFPPAGTLTQDNADMFAEDVEKTVKEQHENRRLMLAAIPGMNPQIETLAAEDMTDA